MLSNELMCALSDSPVTIFDYDSTIVNTKQINYEAYKAAFREVGFDFDISFDDYNQGGGGMNGHIGHIAEVHGVLIGSDLLETMKFHFRDACIRISAEQDIRPLAYFETASTIAGGKVFIVTKNFAEVPAAALLRWEMSVDGCFSAAAYQSKRPVFEALIKGHDPKVCMCFDDHDRHLVHAKKLGMITVGVALCGSKKFDNADFEIR